MWWRKPLPTRAANGRNGVTTWRKSAGPTRRFAFLANSDFHKPKHIYFWKTLLQCEKDPEAIKDCIRRNEQVSLTLYRDGMSGEALRAQPRVEEAIPPEAMALRLALPAAAACNS
jgi:hypothetical protein